MPPGADNVDIQIQALVKGLADVTALVREIQKLPGAGAGVAGLNKQFADVQKQIRLAGTELKAVGTEAQQVAKYVAATGNASKGIDKVGTSAKATRTNLAELSQGASAVGRAFTDAFQGDILGALQSVGVALRTSLNFNLLKTTAIPAVTQLGTSIAGTDKLLARFSSTLGGAAKNITGTLNGTLFTNFGIEAERALINPELALQKFVASLSLIPDAAGRATAAASIFGAGTSALLPTLEAMVAAEQAVSLATAEMVAAQTAAAASQAALATANTTAASSEAALNALRQSGTATSLEIAAAETAAAAAAAEVTVARTAETAATLALVAAEEALTAATGAVIVAEEAATVASIGLGSALTIATAGLAAILAIAGGVILAGVAITKTFSDAGSEIHDMSEQLGIAAPDLVALKLAADQAGSSIDKVSGSVTKYLRNVNEAANGNKELKKIFNELGIDAVKANTDTSDAIQMLFVALSKIPPGAQQVAAAMKLAGKSGADLIPVINQAGGNFDEFKKKAAALGITLSQESVNAADDFGDQMTELGAILTGVRNEVGAALLPTILELAKSLTNFISENRTAISDLAGVISSAVTVALGAFYLLGGVIGFLANLVYGLITAIVGLATSMYDTAAAAVTAGKAVAQFISGDLTGAVNSMNAAVNASRNSLAALTDELRRAQTIIAQPTFTSFFSLLNGGDGSTPKTFGAPKPKPVGSYTGGGGGGGSKKSKGASDAKALFDAQLALEKAYYEARIELARDAIKTEQEILQEQFSQNLIGYQSYYDQLNVLQLRDNAAQINLTKNLIAIEEKKQTQAKKGSERLKGEAEVVKLNTDLEKLYRNQENIVRRTTVEVQKQAKAYKDMLDDINNQLLEFDGEKGAAASNRIDKDFEERLAKAQARAAETGDDSDVKKIERLKQLLRFTEQYKLIQNDVNDIVKERDQFEEALNNKVERGLLTRTQANDQLKAYEQGEAAAIQDRVAAMDNLANKIKDPALLQAVTDVRLQIEKWGIGQVNRNIDDLKGQLSRAQDVLAIRNQEIDTAVMNGAYTEQQAYEQRQQAIQTYADQAYALLSTLEAIAVATNNADLQGYVDKARGDLAGMKADGDSLAQSINQSFLGAFQDLFSSIADGTKTAGEAFADFGRQIIKTLADIAIQVLLSKALSGLFGSGGQGGFGGFLSGLFGGDKAVGGHARGGLIRGVGTGTSDSNLRRLSDGEFVVNAQATADNYEMLADINSGLNPRRNLNAGANVIPAAAAMGGAASQNVKIVNVLPNDLLDNYITGGDGERALLNFIDNNTNAINTRLKQQ